MARSRTHRRRHSLLWTLALVATVLTLFFARDVSRAGHGATTGRRSENLSFAALANALVGQENGFDARLARLITAGGALNRTEFAARLTQLSDQLAYWPSEAHQLSYPVLAHHVNSELATLTEERSAADEAVLADVAAALTLPWPTHSTTSLTAATATLVATSSTWAHERYALAKEPGHPSLEATTDVAATELAAHGLGSLTNAPALALVRAISIAAVRVSPDSLPASPGVWLLPPVPSIVIAVSALNASYDLQPVTLTVSVTPTNQLGHPFYERMSATLGPRGAVALVARPVATVASERATIKITLSGAPAARGRVRSQSIRLEMSPSGNG